LVRLGYSEAQRKREGCHTLRRSVARAYFDGLRTELGYDHALREVAALLHHKSTRTTENYLGVTADKIMRDERMKGQPFLSRLQETSSLRKVSNG